MTQTDIRQPATSSNRWRTVDIVVAAVIAVAFGVVFWAWDQLYNGPWSGVFTFKPAAALIYGVWLVPAVVGPLVIRKPGAAIFTEAVAALVSALLGTPWGLFVLVYGLFQGLAGEAAFALTGYRSWKLPTAVLAGAFAGAAAVLLDLAAYYPDWATGWKWAYAGILISSAALIAGVGGWALTRGLIQTGVLDRFAAGRDRAAV
jgi:energy-coupling factor transport system substrate-specific component